MSGRKRLDGVEEIPRKKLQREKIGIIVLLGKQEHICPACKAPLVWALDDRFDTKKEIGSLFSAEPVPNGEAALWYAVDRHDVPIGKQMFRIIDTGCAYDGPRWTRHTRCEARS